MSSVSAASAAVAATMRRGACSALGLAAHASSAAVLSPLRFAVPPCASALHSPSSARRFVSSTAAVRHSTAVHRHSQTPADTASCAAAAAAASSSVTPALDPSFRTREVQQVLLSKEQSEGVGAKMLDEFKAGKQGGFPDHPHRGFETVTYMLPESTGAFEHEDFRGNKGFLKPGMLQWMTAGKGIVHSEMPATTMRDTDVAWGLQLWVNLAKKNKMVEPRYQEMAAEDVIKVTQGGIEAHVIAGTALGVHSPVQTLTPVEYIHYYLKPHTTLQHRIPKGFNSFIYTLEGKVVVGSEKGSYTKAIDAHNTITLTRGDDLDGVTVSTQDEGAQFVLLAGQPLNEPVVQHGPMVMCERDEIHHAIRDYQTGSNGFEGARGWRSEIGRPITDHMY